MIEEATVVNGVTRTVSYTYNEAGGVTGLTDPWNDTYSYGWDTATRARTVTNPFNETYGLRHNPDGLVTSVVFPTGLDSLTYNADHQVEWAGLNAEIAYDRDPTTKGINQITWGGVTQSFTYDGFDRLASEATSTTGYGPTSEAFVYDAAGNRTGNPTGYTYTATNAVRKRPTISGDSYAPGDSVTYDAAGNPRRWKNLSTGQVDSLFWDAEHRLI